MCACVCVFVFLILTFLLLFSESHVKFLITSSLLKNVYLKLYTFLLLVTFDCLLCSLHKDPFVSLENNVS